ncbi:hypothetical protein HZH68_015259 [Vespula germanica]|uniref:Uncharacterized protein n=1 Tax=Vespula germanica TaxID=30212 RepID=A0A834MRX7_VESGE|nr:hypothetical protein HZH68_015259 [Vespula germanica]
MLPGSHLPKHLSDAWMREKKRVYPQIGIRYRDVIAPSNSFLENLPLSPIPEHSRAVWPTSEVEYTLGEESRMKVEGTGIESGKTRGWLNALDRPMHANAHLTDLQALSFTTPEPVDLSALRLSN